MTERLKKHNLKLNIAFRESSEVLATSFNFSHWTRKLTWLLIFDKPKKCHYFPCLCVPGKVRITNHNNDNNDNPFRKRWRSSRCCVATSTYRYDTEEDLGEWNCLLVTVMCVVKKTKVILLLYSLKSFFHPVFACVTTHRSRQKNLYILQTESQSMNSFFKKRTESYLLPYDYQLSLTHLVAQTEVVHSLMQRLWNAF